MHSKVAHGFTLFLMAVMIASMALAGGCGGSQEGTSARFDPEANKKQQDAMREYMQKQKTGIPGQGGKTKK